MTRTRLLPLLLLPLLLLSCTRREREPAKLSLERTASCIQQQLGTIDSTLHAAARELQATGLDGEEARLVLEQLHARFPSAVDCVTIDRDGRIRELFPESYAGVLNRVIIDQPQVKRALESGMPAMSGLFHSVEGSRAIDAEYPVSNAVGKRIGTVSLLFRPQELIGRCARPETRAAGTRFMAFTSAGELLYRGDSSRADPEPLVMQRLLEEQEGEAESPSEKREKLYWRSVTLFDKSWRILAWPEQPEEATKPQ